MDVWQESMFRFNQAMAKIELENVKQLGSVEDYINSFELVINKLKVTEEFKLEYFLKGLKQDCVPAGNSLNFHLAKKLARIQEQYSHRIRELNEKWEARSLLKNLKQEGSVSDYITSFDLIPHKSCLAEEEIMDYFINGLKEDIVAVMDIFKPTTLQRAIELVKLQEEAMEMMRSMFQNKDVQKEFESHPMESNLQENETKLAQEGTVYDLKEDDIREFSKEFETNEIVQFKEKASEDKGHDSELQVEEATRSQQGLGTSNGTAEAQDPLSFLLNLNDTLGHGDFSCKDGGAIIQYLPYLSLYHYALISAKVLVMESLEYDMQPYGFPLCCTQQHISKLLDSEMVNENQLSQIKLAFKMWMDDFKEEFDEPKQMFTVRYVYDPGVLRKAISNHTILILELALQILRKRVFFARRKLQLELLTQYRDNEDEELYDKQQVLKKLSEPLNRKALFMNEGVAFKVGIYHFEERQFISSMEFAECFINLDAQELDWCQDYSSNFHAIIALRGGTSGRTKVMHPEGIGLKDGSFFTIEETPEKNDDVPECLRTGTKPSLWNAPDSNLLQNIAYLQSQSSLQNAPYEEAGDVKFNLVIFKGTDDKQMCQVVYQILLGRNSYIIWGWFYKDPEKVKETMHPGNWIRQWMIAWM